MNIKALGKLKLTAILLIGFLLVLVVRNWSDLQILYAQQKFSRLITEEYVSKTYQMNVTESYLLPDQARGTFYGIEENTNKEKYILFYFQRLNGNSMVYEVYADEGISRAEAIELLEKNQLEYKHLNISIFGFYLGTRDNDIQDFLYWQTDNAQNPAFIKFLTGELIRNPEKLYQ
jgi:uncharacterized protein YpmB